MFRFSVRHEDLAAYSMAAACAPCRPPPPNTVFAQFGAIKGYLKAGGSAVFLLGEGGEERLGTNVNYLLEEYGMTVHKDSVVSSRRKAASR